MEEYLRLGHMLSVPIQKLLWIKSLTLYVSSGVFKESSTMPTSTIWRFSENRLKNTLNDGLTTGEVIQDELINIVRFRKHASSYHNHIRHGENVYLHELSAAGVAENFVKE